MKRTPSDATAFFMVWNKNVEALTATPEGPLEHAIEVAWADNYKYCCVFTSMIPRVVSLSSGMTGSDMKLRVMNGSMPWETPSL